MLHVSALLFQVLYLRAEKNSGLLDCLSMHDEFEIDSDSGCQGLDCR